MMDDEALARTIGQRLKTIRLQRRQTLQTIASGLGVSYQQVRKYESGQNGISASMLFRAACVLDVDVALFFEEPPGLDGSQDAHAPQGPDGLSEALGRVDDPDIRRHLADLIRILTFKTNRA